MGAVEKIYLSPADFLEFERASDTKHEYYQGEVFDMSGASLKHNILFSNIFSGLTTALKGKECRPFGSDLRVHIPINTLYTYPDISVVCGKVETTDDSFDTITNPTVIIEILSASTRNYDLGKKFLLYRQIPSLKNYIMIDSEEVRVLMYTRNDNQTWIFEEHTNLENILTINAIGTVLEIKNIYETVDFK